MLNKVKYLLGNEKCSRELLTREEGERVVGAAEGGGRGGPVLNRVVGESLTQRDI